MPAATKPTPLRELHFGTLDAAEEAVDEPSLLLDGYFDYREAALALASRGCWLLLGQKGAGKSAVLEHLRLKWEGRADRLFTLWDLRSFPVADVPMMQSGLSQGASRARTNWEFLLLLRIVESLKRDGGLSAPRSYFDMVRELSERGYLTGDWPSKVARWKVSGELDLKFIKGGVERTADRVTPLDVSAVVRETLRSVLTDSQHLIALDGLDSFFFETDDEWQSLAGLLHAAEHLNRFFVELGTPISVCAAVRSDIFNIVPSPDLNKLKPKSIHLDWSALGIGAANHLWKMLETKAAVGRPQVRNNPLVATYMQVPIRQGQHREMAPFLLDHTRLLPRDTVALMNIVKEEHPGSTPITEREMLTATKRYCKEYFEGEIFDNLAGVLAPGNAGKLRSFKEALRTLPRSTFTLAELQTELDGELSAAELKSLLKQMFDVGGIGIRNPTGAREYTDFAYRSINGAGFTARYKFMLQDALAVAWNRPK